ncbi:MAG: MoxR family ATPase [Planctomycetes bacterium]|nr:MoxR family ATPase [Planctomycetota bacterium]
MAPENEAPADPLASGDLEELARLREAHARVKAELAHVIVGQEEVIDQLLVAIFSQGHCILEGVPGLAKTLMVSTLAGCLHLSFHRIQFTPDLMPSDITGTEVIQEDKATGHRQFKFLRGPVFANVILADEINRTPPKTQAALLEAMQEKQVTIGGERHTLPVPFFVLATQNPIEQEGTYPLPEAQQDRFMFKLFVRYPSFDEEYRIAETTTALYSPEVSQVLASDQIIRLQGIVRRVPVPPHAIRYALRLVRATRVSEGPENVPPFIKEWVTWGAGPRAAQYLLLGGKARAALDGRTFVTTGDIKAVAHPVLRHRIITNFTAESEGVTPDRIVDQLISTIAEAESPETLAGEAAKVFSPHVRLHKA